MKTKQSGACVIVAMGCILAWNVAQADLTGQVYEVSMSGSIVSEESIGPEQEVVAKGKFAASHLINLARGRSADAVVPANEKLGLLFLFNDGDHIGGALVVYDTTGHTVLVDIAEMIVRGAFDSAKGKGTLALAGAVQHAGYFTQGWLAATGKASVNNANPVTPLTTFNGALQGVFAGNDGEDFEVIITKGKAVMGSYLGPAVFPN